MQASVNIVNKMLCFPSSLFQYTLSIVTNDGFKFLEVNLFKKITPPHKIKKNKNIKAYILQHTILSNYS